MEFAPAATSLRCAGGGSALETELKITVDADGLAALKRHPGLARRRIAPRRSEALVSVYYDTPGHALAAAGIALRLRRVGRRWVQTIKRGRGGFGLFANAEVEVPAPGGRLVLEGPDPEGLIAAIVEVAAGAPLSPMFETRIRRTTERLRAPGGGEVELALDAGEIVAGDARAPIHEVELELKSDDVRGIYDIARELFPSGPVRFSTASKAARGYRLARGEGEPRPSARSASPPDFGPEATVEAAAREVFRDCFAQIAANMARVADSEDAEGPHQLRVGLRRLRTAFATFACSLGDAALRPLSDEARRLGQVVGALRDLDVLTDEVVADAAAIGLDDPARAALVASLEARRRSTRAEVRRALAAPEAAGFLFDLGALIEGRGWLEPSDCGQCARLVAPIGTVAAEMLDARLARVTRRGRGIRKLDAEGLHALRKELKKLRYAADTLAPLYPGKAVARYVAALKALQDGFGSLNDAAMARTCLTDPGTPASPQAQRAVGWVLGALAARSGTDRPRLFAGWEAFAEARPFWR